MEVKTVALIIFSCIVCVQVTSAYRWGHAQDGYANLETQSTRETPALVQQNSDQLINAKIDEKSVMEAVTQISRGSERFATELFQVCKSSKLFT